MSTPSDATKLAAQAVDYGKIADACVAVTRCVGITTWALSDKWSWIPAFFPGEGAALPFDESYQPKPAYDALVASFGGTTNPASCTATYQIVSEWPGGFQANITVKAGSAPISRWTVGWTFANAQTVSWAWHTTITANGPTVTAKNASYNGSISAGGSTVFGFIGTRNGVNSAPSPTCSTT
jgi:endo-1,4-beta-xylanase